MGEKVWREFMKAQVECGKVKGFRGVFGKRGIRGSSAKKKESV